MHGKMCQKEVHLGCAGKKCIKRWAAPKDVSVGNASNDTTARTAFEDMPVKNAWLWMCLKEVQLELEYKWRNEYTSEYVPVGAAS
jgi:hypothetical protein